MALEVDSLILGKIHLQQNVVRPSHTITRPEGVFLYDATFDYTFTCLPDLGGCGFMEKVESIDAANELLLTHKCPADGASSDPAE